MTSSGIDSKKLAMVSDSSNPDSLFSTKTPDKSAILPIRSRNSDVSLSVPEIKPQSSRDSNRLPIKPVKRQIFSPPRKSEKVVKLPERFVILEELFNGLDTAIRLLKLKGSLTTFANICPKIQYLTNRVFSYGDLAQIKHIYPEAIEVKRVLKYDQGTSCMKPSLHISLNIDAIVLDDTSCGTKYIELRKVFHSKLVDFYKAHPEDEIPKELLPEPFNSPKTDSYSDTVSVDLGAPNLEVEEFDVRMEEMEQEQHIVNKVIPDSTLSDGTEECLLLNTESSIVGAPKLEVAEFDVRMEEMEQEQRIVDKVTPDSTLSAGIEEGLDSQKKSSIVATPVKDLSTPSKDLSTPIRLMSATPTLQPTRRCITMTPDDNSGSVRSTYGMEKRPSRCLKFDTLEEDRVVKDEISNKSVDEGSNYEPDDAYGEDTLLYSLKDKPEAELGKQNLPKLVDLIHKLFHSTKRSIITKEELLHKLIACQIDITDRKEVEEQLKVMLQSVPDWISETKASSGDFLVRINKVLTAETVRARLEEATTTSHGISTV